MNAGICWHFSSLMILVDGPLVDSSIRCLNTLLLLLNLGSNFGYQWTQALLTRHSIDACFYPTWTISWWLHIIYIMSTMLGQPYHHMLIIKKQCGNPIVIAFSKIIASHLRGNRYSVASQSKHHTGSVHPGCFHIRLWLVVMDENLTKRTGSGWPYHICLANQ